MLIYDETILTDIIIESDNIIYFYPKKHPFRDDNGNLTWEIIFALKHKSSITWSYSDGDQQKEAMKKLYKILNIQSINNLVL